MKKNKSGYIVTTPAYYPSSRPHIGHWYSNLLARIISDFLAAPVISGCDLHGSKMRKAAELEGNDPRLFSLKNQSHFNRLFDLYTPLHNYAFINTEHPKHKELLLQIWNKLIKSNFVYSGYYEGWYNIQDECFVTRDVGDDLVYLKEKTLFLNLLKIRGRLLEMIDSGQISIFPSRYLKQLISIVHDIDSFCLLRREPWGISSGISDMSIHVWLDALCYYITASKIMHADKFSFIHVIGKDILTFHGLYWPCILIACDISFKMKIVVTGWMLEGNAKLSKRSGGGNWLSVYEMILPLALGSKVGSDIRLSQDSVSHHMKVFNHTICNFINRVFSLMLKSRKINSFPSRTLLCFKRLNWYDVSVKLCRECNRLMQNHSARNGIVFNLLIGIAYSMLKKISSFWTPARMQAVYFYHLGETVYVDKEGLRLSGVRLF